MAITEKDKQKLNEFYKNHAIEGYNRKEDYFPLMYLSEKFNKDVEEIKENVAFGNNDYGVDAFYIDKERRNLYLYQFKWSENHNLFKDSLERLTNEGIERIFGDLPPDPQKNELLINLKAELKENKNIIDKVYIQFICKGDSEKIDNSAGLDNRRESLEEMKYIIDSYFGENKIELFVEFLSDKRNPKQVTHKDIFTLSFYEHLEFTHTKENKVMYLGFVNLIDLYNIYQTLGQMFFSRNIRAGLKAENPPNRKIREALSNIVIKESVPPEMFTFNHNGITLAAQEIEFVDSKAIIKVPKLLNGAQTLSSVTKFCEDNKEKPDFIKNKSKFNNIKILCKIVIDSDPASEFVNNVTISNNQQNPVEPWNLRANDKIQVDLQDKFQEEAKIYYSRQENAFFEFCESELEEMGVDPNRDIRIKPLAQTFLALQGEIDKISRMVEVFNDQKMYAETFKQSYLNSDVKKLVLIYKVNMVINGPLDELQNKMAYKTVLRRGKNLIWALLIQGLLNSPKLDEYIMYYGKSLKREKDYRDILKSIASSRIRPILQIIFRNEKYQEYIKKEKYEFIRSKEIYRRCMNVASNKYGWNKKSI